MNLADTIKLRIARPQVEAMLAAFPQLARWEESLRFGGQLEVAFERGSVFRGMDIGRPSPCSGHPPAQD